MLLSKGIVSLCAAQIYIGGWVQQLSFLAALQSVFFGLQVSQRTGYGRFLRQHAIWFKLAEDKRVLSGNSIETVQHNGEKMTPMLEWLLAIRTMVPMNLQNTLLGLQPSRAKSANVSIRQRLQLSRKWKRFATSFPLAHFTRAGKSFGGLWGVWPTSLGIFCPQRVAEVKAVHSMVSHNIGGASSQGSRQWRGGAAEPQRRCGGDSRCQGRGSCTRYTAYLD